MCPDKMLIPRTEVMHHSLSGKYFSLTSQVSSSQAGRRCQLSHPFSGDLFTCFHVKCFLYLTSQGTWRWKLKKQSFSRSQWGEQETPPFFILGFSFSALPTLYSFLREACPACGKAERASDPILVLSPLLPPPQVLQEPCRRVENCWTFSF